MEQLSLLGLLLEDEPPASGGSPPEAESVLDVSSWTDEEVEWFIWSLLERTLEYLFNPNVAPAHRRELHEWIQEPSGSFTRIVKALGLDPDAMREAVDEAMHLVEDRSVA